ncbi:MAG: hypothetical protein ACYC1Z_12275 [Georgenia sp.]
MSTAPPAEPVRDTQIMITGGPGVMVVDTAELEAIAVHLDVAAAHVAAAGRDAQAATGSFAVVERDNIFAPAAPMPRDLLAPQSWGTFPRLAEQLRALAGDLRVQALWYAEADRAVSTTFWPDPWRFLTPFAPVGVRIGLGVLDGATLLGHLGAARSTLGGPVPDAIAMQRHTAAFAEDAQYWGGDMRFGFALVDGQFVGAWRATPAERTALGMLTPADAVGLATRLGAEYPGLSVEQVDPTAAIGPAGLLASSGPFSTAPPVVGIAVVPPIAAAPATVVLVPRVPAVPAPPRPVRNPPTGPGQALRRIGALERHVRATGAGAVEILRTTALDGRRSWTVVVPGTQASGSGGRNPMDNETNLRALGGAVSDMEVGIATAMDQAGIAPGEPVAIAAHSQGGLVSARLVADPLFRARFDVTTLLTAGSPVGPVELPETVRVLSLEDVQDRTVGLDGQPNTPTDHHVTVAVNAGTGHDPHHLTTYAGHADLLDGVADPGVQAWLRANEHAMGTSSPGARTDSFVFEIARTR